jgi:hypothetical protein
MKKITTILVVLLGLLGLCSAQVPVSKHVYVIMDENHKYVDVLARMPYLVSLGTKYAHTLNYHADESGSLLDYLWISSGSGEHAFGCNGSGCKLPITSDNIFRSVNAASLQWRSYQESIPYAGFMGYSSGLYLRRHNPAAFYSDVLSSKSEQLKIVPFTQLAADIAADKLPNYAFITPNAVNDAHNQVGTTDSLKTADDWLRSNLVALLASKPFQPGGDGVLFITFDECDGAASGICGGNVELVYTAVIGPKVKAGATSSVLYKHENALATIAALLQVKSPTTAAPMADLFNPDPLITYAPVDRATYTSPVAVYATDQQASRIEVWVDHVKKFQVAGQELKTSLALPVGQHRFVLSAVLPSGALQQKVMYINVK